MKTITHKYRGYIITSFNLRQLGDSSVRGRSYNVYRTEGGQSLSASECLTTLAAAREFVLNRIDQAFAEKPDAAADRAFAVYDASLTVAFAAHAAALATTDADDLAIALARREVGNKDFHSAAVAVAETALSLADAAYDAAARSAADAYDAAYDADLSSVQP